MNKTKIEWTDYTKNPIKGRCKIGCWYCYALRMYKRFKWNPEVRFAPEVLNEIQRIKKPSKIFLCSTHELFGRWIPNKWREVILSEIKKYPQHTFQFLTKQPQHIPKGVDYGKNVWVGATITRNDEMDKLYSLVNNYAGNKFISFEPLLSAIGIHQLDGYFGEVGWVIIGKLTGSKKVPLEKEWVLYLIRQCRARRIPLFIKNNVGWPEKIQEFPG